MNAFAGSQQSGIDRNFKLIAARQAAARGPVALGKLVSLLADPDRVVGDTAASLLQGLLPLAALPERWPDDRAPREADAPVPAWISRSAAQGATHRDLAAAAARHAAALPADLLDAFLERLALFPGAQRSLRLAFTAAGLRHVASVFTRRVLALRRLQYPLQISLSTTMACQLRCDFCVAEEPDAGTGSVLTDADRTDLLDWMVRHGVSRLSLTGGEPTLYAGFPALLEGMRRRSIELNVATNGLLSDAVRDDIIRSRPLCVTMHLAPEITGQRMETYLRNARGFVEAGVYTVIRSNLPRPDADYRRFLSAARSAGVTEIRTAIPMPNAHRVNRYTQPGEFSGYRELLKAFAAEAREQRITLRLSKPLPLCLLDEGTAQAFLANGSYSANCPVHMTGYTNNVVIYPDLSFSPCLGLNVKVRKRITDFPSLRAAALEYRRPVQELMGQPLFEHCPACPLSEGGRCLGACLSYRPDPASRFAANS